MSDKLAQIFDERKRLIRSLSINAAQASAQQVKLVSLLEEISHENMMLRRGFAQLKNEVEALKQERVAAF